MAATWKPVFQDGAVKSLVAREEGHCGRRCCWLLLAVVEMAWEEEGAGWEREDTEAQRWQTFPGGHTLARGQESPQFS